MHKKKIIKGVIKVCIVWDFDAPIGRINSSYPYNYHFEKIKEELQNVNRILDLCNEYGFKNTFAITGFSAEEGVYPFSIQELIRKIHTSGHEIASHSWKHEWLPFLTDDQLIKTMTRSKLALESCLEVKDSVIGFVPPFSKPSTWIRKFSYSLGDRALYPFHPNANLGKIVNIAEQVGYKWIRVSYRNLTQKLIGKNPSRELEAKWERFGKIVTVPQNYVGFDEEAIKCVSRAISKGRDLVVCGHPHGLSINNRENIQYLISFFGHLKKKETEGLLEINTVSSVIANARN